MAWSKFNIVSKIHDSENYIIVNLLQGQADIVTPEQARFLDSSNPPSDASFFEKGYWIDPVAESKLHREKYLDFLDIREKEEIQIFFVPWYACNFSCSYCFQDEYATSMPNLSNEAMDSFFKYVRERFAGRKKYITLFGGEPLLDGSAKMGYIERFFEQANANALSVAVVTNGYNLVKYRDILRKGLIREIQVTLDGLASVHNARRPLLGGGDTFDKIVAGIDMALEDNYTVNLRVVVDKKNIDELLPLADFAKKRGWIDSDRFKTQIGRNYELHHCQSRPDDLFERAALYEKLYQLAIHNPVVAEFHKPSFSVMRFLAENGNLPDPLFDACPGTKSEWAFDSAGRIFSCTATVGKEDEVLGTYYPEVKLDEELVGVWSRRDILSIDKCQSCNLSLACGGGCASIAKNRNGSYNSPDCRPIDKLVSLGSAYYFKKEIADG